MGVWSNETLYDRLPALITPFYPTRVQCCAYELRLGEEYFTTSQKTKESLAHHAPLYIPPGQLALLITEEKVKIPPDALGLISIRSKYKLQGLINVSGFHADPGFEGKLIEAWS